MKNLIKSFIKLTYLFVTGIAYKKKPITAKTILIIKPDGFGDYVLFRNYLYFLKQQPQFSSYSITLVGNVIWQEFASYFDGQVVDKFIWLNRKQFIKNICYRFKKIRQINQIGYEVVLYPSYLRETIYGDSIARCVSARVKIASIGDIGYRPNIENMITNGIYSSIIAADTAKVSFEFYRNREFFTNWLGLPITTNLSLQFTGKRLLADNYIVLFIGASSKIRQWSVEYFLALAELLYKHYQLKIVLAGQHGDLDGIDNLTAAEYLVNLVGKTSQLELVNLLRYAQFVISNETVVPHLCVALATPVFVLYNGNNYKRFSPYPVEMSAKYVAINHPFIDSNPEYYCYISNKNNYVTSLAMADITVDRVFNTITATVVL
jgi:ADP-heptose:LPS heptosyltransferase